MSDETAPSVRIVNNAKCGCQFDGKLRPLRYCVQHVDQMRTRAADASAYKRERDSAEADAGRLAAALRNVLSVVEVVDEMVPQPDVLEQCRAALARHEETSP